MVKILLAPISLIYSLIVRFRNFLFTNDIIKSVYFNNVFLISVGNLAVGGTGKTPHTELLIKILKEKFKIAVLSRGYKRKTKGFVLADSNSDHIQIGDEPLQIYQKFPNTTVAVCEDRSKGIRKISNDFSPQIIVLDDAFQHRKIKPGLNILLTEYNRPFFKDHFLPIGRLRDNIHEYMRANYIIITKCPQDIKPIEKSIWRNNINLRPYQKLFFTYLKYKPLSNIYDTEKTIDETDLKNYSLLVFTGIANPQYLIDYLKKNSQISKQIIYSDHKNYSKKDFEHIIENFEKIEATKKIIVTTEKDAVRIKKIVSEQYLQYFYFQPIEIEFLFDQKEEFETSLLKDIEKK